MKSILFGSLRLPFVQSALTVIWLQKRPLLNPLWNNKGRQK
jgi:hypothetical protein